MIIYLPFIFYGNFQGMAIFPFIFVRHKYMKKDQRLINHEKIHLRQQIEMLWLFFFLFYLTEYLINLIQYQDANTAYREISFEKEAYENDYNLEYLKKRKFWNFFNYL